MIVVRYIMREICLRTILALYWCANAVARTQVELQQEGPIETDVTRAALVFFTKWCLY